MSSTTSLTVAPVAAPTARTDAADEVTSGGATLHGTVNARNEATTVWFEYGLSTLYISGIAATPNSVSGLSDVLVSAGVSGLLPNTTYHYQVVAENSAGRTEGGDRVFTTAKIPPAFLSLGVTSGERDAAIQVTVIANNAETSMSLEYGPTSAREWSVPGDPPTVSGMDATIVSFALADLTPNMTYYYRIVAESDGETAL